MLMHRPVWGHDALYSADLFILLFFSSREISEIDVLCGGLAIVEWHKLDIFLFCVLQGFIYPLSGCICLIVAPCLPSLAKRRSMSRPTGRQHAAVVALTDSFSSDSM